jgi:hypothetical protein
MFVIGRNLHVEPLVRYLLAQYGISPVTDGPSRVGACEEPCHWLFEACAIAVVVLGIFPR